MDIDSLNMDIRPIYAGELTRLRRQVFPIQHIGQMSAKREWVRHTFETFNFSFIFEGEGSYLDLDGEHAVSAPCVLTQWPGTSNVYGPTGESKAWNELFVVYDGRLVTSLTSSLRLPKTQRFWQMENPDRVSALQAELVALTHSADVVAEIDRIDLICESMIMESLPVRPVAVEPALQQVEALRCRVEAEFMTLESVDALALEYGLSRSVFRRCWASVCPLPPGRYLMDLKLKYACRLLVETSSSIGAIAEQLGFKDPLYFSRKFRQSFGMTASSYRKKYFIVGGGR